MKNIYDILIEKRRINEDRTVYVGEKEFKISDFVRVFGRLATGVRKGRMIGSLFMADKIEIKDEYDASLVRQVINYFDNSSKRLISVSGDISISNCSYLNLFLFHERRETIKKSKYIQISNFSRKGTTEIFIESCEKIKIDESNANKGKDIYVDRSKSVFVTGNFNSLNVDESKVYIKGDEVKTNIKEVNALNNSSVSISTTVKIGKIFSDDTSEIIDSLDHQTLS